MELLQKYIRSDINGTDMKRLNPIARYVKENRRKLGMTQEEFAIRSGLGLNFVRDLEQGKETLRMDKVNQALSMFSMQAVPGKMDHDGEE